MRGTLATFPDRVNAVVWEATATGQGEDDMKRMAALLAVMGAMTGVVPAAAPAATSSGVDTSGVCNGLPVLALRLC